MKAVFLDSSGLIAKVNRRDDWHTCATAVWADLLKSRTPLITTSLILIELGDSLSRLRQRQLALDMRARLMQSARVEVIAVTSADEHRGWRLFEQRSDKEWGVTDCVSIDLMRERGINHVFAADRHFEQAGYTILLKA